MGIQTEFSLAVNQSLVSLRICIIKETEKKRKGRRKGKEKKENRNLGQTGLLS